MSQARRFYANLKGCFMSLYPFQELIDQMPAAIFARKSGLRAWVVYEQNIRNTASVSWKKVFLTENIDLACQNAATSAKSRK